MRPIDADELFYKLVNTDPKTPGNFGAGVAKAMGFILNAPTIEAEPARHGRWVDRMVRDWHCSECGKKLTGHGWDGYCYKDLPLYCPNCGAKMDLED